MKVIKNTVLFSYIGSFLLAGFSVSAFADDVRKWEGIYGGFAIGGAYGEANPATEVILGNYFITNANGSDKGQLEPILQRKIGGWDLSGSALAGYEYQVDKMTYGIEADLTAARYKETEQAGPIVYDTNAGGNFTTQTTVETDFTFSIRPKVGYVINDFQFYVSAGPSVSKFKTTFEFQDTIGGGNQLTSIEEKIAFGGSSSVGVGYQIGNGWALRGDYVFTYFPDIAGGEGFLNNDAMADFGFDGDFQSHNMRFAVIKHF